MIHDRLAQDLFEGVMAPLVIGGDVRPVHAIGVRDALALGNRIVANDALAARVESGRVRTARRLAPVDTLPAPQASDWALAAAVNDIFVSVNPAFDRPLWRRAAARILEVASAILARVNSPASTGEALARHAWLSRLLQVQRTDTAVSWWVGSRKFLGEEVPPRLRAWPRLRRVSLTTSHHVLLDLNPLAVDRGKLGEAVAALFVRTPLTDIATCTRSEPEFVWTAPVLDLLAKDAGRTLALRAIAQFDADEVDTALGRATRALWEKPRGDETEGVLRLLSHRALMFVSADEPADVAASSRLPSGYAVFARAVGAVAAKRVLATDGASWPTSQRDRLLLALDDLAARDKTVAKLVGSSE